jgi:23S rRNA pseudouridine1911/1915/1917 synthase
MTPGPSPFSVIYEDNHLLVVNKPAELPTMGVEASRPSLLSVAKTYIAAKYQKPGNVYLGIVSRLDAPVTGIVVIARTSKAARRLSEQFRNGTVTKTYLALVQPGPRPSDQPVECTDWLKKHERHRKVLVVDESTPAAQEARLRFISLGKSGRRALLRVTLLTGRKHQIRVQLSSRDFPILGDRKYGSSQGFPMGIALHSSELIIEHPVRKERLQFECPLPKCWDPFLPRKRPI